MKILKIHCKNCEGTGIIDHPSEGFCPFCDGDGYRDIEYGAYSEDAKSVTGDSE